MCICRYVLYMRLQLCDVCMFFILFMYSVRSVLARRFVLSCADKPTIPCQICGVWLTCRAHLPMQRLELLPGLYATSSCKQGARRNEALVTSNSRRQLVGCKKGRSSSNGFGHKTEYPFFSCALLNPSLLDLVLSPCLAASNALKHPPSQGPPNPKLTSGLSTCTWPQGFSCGPMQQRRTVHGHRDSRVVQPGIRGFASPPGSGSNWLGSPTLAASLWDEAGSRRHSRSGSPSSRRVGRPVERRRECARSRATCVPRR